MVWKAIRKSVSTVPVGFVTVADVPVPVTLALLAALNATVTRYSH